MWETAGARIRERKQLNFRHFKNRKIGKVRLKPSEADKAVTPARRMSNPNSGCLYLKERFSPVTAEEYVLSSWLLVSVLFTLPKTKPKVTPYPTLLSAEGGIWEGQQNMTKSRPA